MECRDVPALARFEAFAHRRPECEVTQATLTRVREIIAPVSKPVDIYPMDSDTMLIRGLKESCVAVESATRIIWACAACTDQIVPPMWIELPEFDKALLYFRTLPDLELMKITKQYRLAWEVEHSVDLYDEEDL